MLGALKNFVKSGGAGIALLAKDAAKIKELKKGARNIKAEVKFTEWIFGAKDKPITSNMGSPGQYGKYQMPVPKDAYMSYQGVPLQNIRPYTDMEVSQSETSRNWSDYL